MSTTAKESSTAWCIARACFLALWLAASATFGLGILEFGSMRLGAGYAHLSAPTYITVLVLHVVGGIIGFLSYRAYRGVIGYTSGYLLGLGFWLLAAFLAALVLPWHYGRVCDTMQAPSACETVTWEEPSQCVPGVDDVCYERLERACRLGGASGCSRLVANGSWSEEQVCEALSRKCKEVRACTKGTRQERCEDESTPAFEEHVMSSVCFTFERRCGE